MGAETAMLSGLLAGLGLVGWVANQPDGTVRVVAEGPEESLRQLLAFLHRGSPSARVERVDSVWTDASGAFTDFQVRHV